MERNGAFGNMKRVGIVNLDCRCGTIGSKSRPSAPRPCNQITAAFAGLSGLNIMQESSLVMVFNILYLGLIPLRIILDSLQYDLSSILSWYSRKDYQCGAHDVSGICSVLCSGWRCWWVAVRRGRFIFRIKVLIKRENNSSLIFFSRIQFHHLITSFIVIAVEYIWMPGSFIQKN